MAVTEPRQATRSPVNEHGARSVMTGALKR